MSNTEKELENEMNEFILEFCEKIGPRPPCSSEEREAAKLFRDKMKNYCDEVKI